MTLWMMMATLKNLHAIKKYRKVDTEADQDYFFTVVVATEEPPEETLLPDMMEKKLGGVNDGGWWIFVLHSTASLTLMMRMNQHWKTSLHRMRMQQHLSWKKPHVTMVFAFISN